MMPSDILELVIRPPFRPGKPRVWREEQKMSALPKLWGAYRFVAEDGRIDYVGITSNIYRRISQHRSLKTHYQLGIHLVHYQIAEDGIHWDDLRNWEIAKINRHSPGLVKYIGGNGRRPAIQINRKGPLIELKPDQTAGEFLSKVGLWDRFVGLFRT